MRVSTAADTASSEAVRSGNAFRMTEKIAAAKTAKRCQALFRQPGWYRREPDAERQAERQGLFEQAAERGSGCDSLAVPSAGAAAAGLTAPGP